MPATIPGYYQLFGIINVTGFVSADAPDCQVSLPEQRIRKEILRGTRLSGFSGDHERRPCILYKLAFYKKVVNDKGLVKVPWDPSCVLRQNSGKLVTRKRAMNAMTKATIMPATDI